MVVFPNRLGSVEDAPICWKPWRYAIWQPRSQPLLRPATDFGGAAETVLPGGRGLLRAGRDGSSTETRIQGGSPRHLYLFHRPALWNPHDRVWMGYERKRGKLEQFNALLLETRSQGVPAGAAAAFSDIVGDQSILGSIRYVITLDTDTQLPRDAAHKLIGNMAHPLNRPVYDAKKVACPRAAILQPRAPSATPPPRLRFNLLFAGEAGIDPYTREVPTSTGSLRRRSFIGKGI